MSPTSILRTAARQSIRSRISRPVPSSRCIRPFSQTLLSKYPRKDSQDRDSINTEATEYSKSGTDDAAAKQEEAAFDPENTDPANEGKVAGEGGKSGNPLEVSPANPEVSKPRGGTEGGAEHSAGNNKRSGGGSPKKAGTP